MLKEAFIITASVSILGQEIFLENHNNYHIETKNNYDDPLELNQNYVLTSPMALTTNQGHANYLAVKLIDI